jgi:LCP family protein required for cell wall assembly
MRHQKGRRRVDSARSTARAAVESEMTRDELVTKKKRRKRKKILWWTAGSVVVLLIGSAITFASIAAGTYASKVTVIDDVFPEIREPAALGAPQNILLLGSDTRGAISSLAAGVLGSRSDTMMLVHIPADKKKIQVISILRDSWVDIPGNGKGKVNWALSFGALPLAVETVENIFDTRIDHVAVVDFSGFREVTEALGGVTIDNTVAFNAKGFSFPVGVMKLSGEEALTYVRERKSFSQGDAQRAINQQTFVKGMFSGILSRDTLTNPATLLATVDSLASSMAVDEGLNISYLAGMAPGFSELTTADIEFFTLPISGGGRTGPHAYVFIDIAQLKLIKVALSNDTLDEYIANR